MNVERLNAISQAILNDISETNILTRLDQLTSSLQEQVNSPSAPAPQENIAKLRETIASDLENAESNDFSLTWQQTISEIGASDLIGTSLNERINASFLGNEATPAVILSKTNTIRSEVDNLKTTLEKLTGSLRSLSIGSETLEPGESEVGVLVPRAFVNNRLKEFGTELIELHKIFGVFSEIATGSRDGFKIRTISSSDLTVFLEAAIPVAACIAVAVEKLISTYKNLLDIRRHHAQLEDKGLPTESLQGINDYADDLMSKRISELDSELLDEFLKNANAGRKNELEIELNTSLTKLARRIDQGFSIEVRVQPLLGTNDEPNDNDANEKYVAQIQKASDELQYVKLEGSPILRLPEPTLELKHQSSDGGATRAKQVPKRSKTKKESNE